MESVIQFINISPEEFARNIVKQVLELQNPEEEAMLTQQEIADYYKVTKQTIINWQKRGVINAYLIDNVIRYKKSELNEKLKKI